MKTLSLIFLLSLSTCFGQLFEPGGVLHFYGASKAVLTNQHNQFVSAYKANFDKGHSYHNYLFGVGASVYKRNGFDFQVRIGYGRSKRLMRDFTALPYYNDFKMTNDFDFGEYGERLYLEISGFKEIMSSRKLTHWAGFGVAYQVNSSTSFFSNSVEGRMSNHKIQYYSKNTSNQEGWHNSNWDYPIPGYDGTSYSFVYGSSHNLKGQPSQTSWNSFSTSSSTGIFLEAKYAVQMRLGQEFFPRFELSLGNSFSRNYRYANRWFIEASVGFSLLQDYGSIKRMRAARKAKKRAKNN